MAGYAVACGRLLFRSGWFCGQVCDCKIGLIILSIIFFFSNLMSYVEFNSNISVSFAKGHVFESYRVTDSPDSSCRESLVARVSIPNSIGPSIIAEKKSDLSS